MTKILITSDWHVDATTAGVERLPEIAEYVSRLETSIVEDGIDLVLNLGDCWDPGSVHDPRWGSFVYAAFRDLASLARGAESRREPRPIGLVAIPGNHDVIDTGEPISTLTPLRVTKVPGILVLETPHCVVLKELGVALLALPYISRAFERTEQYQRAFDRAFIEAYQAKRHYPLIAMGHLSFEGMHPGSETTEMGRGREVPFPLREVAQVGPDVVVNGHYHARQTIRRGELDIEIPGAPVRFTFGEASDGPRGFMIVEV